MDLSKAIIPEGQLEELRNIPLKELTKDFEDYRLD